MKTDRVEQAYRRMHPRLWHALLGYTRDPEVASDAEAEAFAQVLRRGRAVRDIDAWVWRSAFRIAAGMMLERGERPPHEMAAVEAHFDASLAEFLSQLQDLSAQQRTVVILRYVGGFKPAEIASLLHTSSGTVRVQLHRAHAQLKDAMEHADG